MSDEVKKEVVQENVDVKEQPKSEQITIDLNVAFNLKLQEFDKKIAEAELAVAKLKSDRSSYIYDQNVQQIVLTHKEQVLKAQIEQETKKKLAEKVNV